MNLRMRFVTDWQRDCWTMTELCADYQISRKTGYKWVDRFEAAGPRGLEDRTRRPAHSPGATDPALVEALMAVRTRHPRWGAKKLLAVAARHHPRAEWPSRSTVCSVRARGSLIPAWSDNQYRRGRGTDHRRGGSRIRAGSAIECRRPAGGRNNSPPVGAVFISV